ncbi:MAG: hypothetical protein U1C74_11300, partial [Phenylobacterium sp.]|nr:hypothetical protein [Phenylobacterium sp.]
EQITDGRGNVVLTRFEAARPDRLRYRTSSGSEAVIVGAEMVAGHDGTVELLVVLRHPNGAEGPVVLDEQTGLNLMAACGAASVDDLSGQSWRKILEGSRCST